MKALLRLYVTVAVLMLGALLTPARAASGSDESVDEALLRSRMEALAAASTSADSLTQIFRLMDLIPPSMYRQMATTLYELARRDNGNTALEVLRLLTIMYENDAHALRAILHQIESFPPSDEREETELFAHIYMVKLEADLADMPKRKARLVELTTGQNAKADDEDPYERLLRLFTICLYTRHVTQGTMLTDQMHMLDRELLRHPLRTYAIRRTYHDLKADVYTANDEPQEAVEADKELLVVLDGMDNAFSKSARKHLSLNAYRYRAYTRLLRNFSALTLSEADRYYAELNALADSVPEVRALYDQHRYPDIYHLLAHKRWDDVRPLLTEAAAKESDIYRRQFLLRQLIELARATGDDSLMLRSVTDYLPLLARTKERKQSDSRNEMEVIYNLNKIDKENQALRLESERQTTRMRRKAIVWISVAVALCAIAVGVLVALSLRYRRTGMRLRAANRKLLEQRNRLRNGRDELLEAIDTATEAERSKSAFIKYISSTISMPLASIMEYAAKIVDGSDAASRRFLQRFADVMQENSERLQHTARRLQSLSRDNERPSATANHDTCDR